VSNKESSVVYFYSPSIIDAFITFGFKFENRIVKIHFIAIGGSAMHNLALELSALGHEVTGSDDHIFEPSKSRLNAAGLLPPSEGWDPAKITTDLDAVILGMHAHPDNPELERVQEMGIKLYSYPEFLYSQSRDKTRVVIAGSHGKTTITSMILHVLGYHELEADFYGWSAIGRVRPHGAYHAGGGVHAT
jgi:UDP-N-acetylmuramate: L-alanyl-gamma-D-glutamyl-meso-diaminopimelate ligase